MEHVTEEQFKKYFELKNNYEKNHISLTKEEIEFVNKVNEHVVNCFSCTTHFKQMEEQEKKKQEEKQSVEQLSEEYGIDFKNIKHIRLKNGKEYYKLYDTKLNKDYLLEQNDKNKNLSEEFKEIQQQVRQTQMYSSTSNADEIFRYQLLHSSNGRKLYSISKIQSHPDLLENITTEQKKAINILLKNKDNLHLISINIESGIAIDEKHEMITAELNPLTKEYEINKPQEYQYDSNTVTGVEIVENLDSIDVNEYQIEVVDDIPTVVNGEDLDPAKVKFFYEYPEALKKQQLDQKRRLAYLIAIKKYQLLQEAKIRRLEQQDVKKYVKVKDNKNRMAGFASPILLALLTGFAGGVITTIMYMIIK